MRAAVLCLLSWALPARAAPSAGLWVDKAWLAGAKSDAQTAAFAERLRGLGIDTVFVRLGPVGAGGTFQAYDSAAARRWVAAMRGGLPGARLLVWTGGVNQEELPRGTVRLGDPDWRARAAKSMAFVVRDAGFDGVHLNVEPVRSGDPELFIFLGELRAELPQGALISYAAQKVRPDWMPAWRGLDARYWRLEDLRELAPLVDQLAVMAYDTALPTRRAYRAAVRRNADAFLSLQDPSTGLPEVLIGVPTYEEPSWYHRPTVENITAGLTALSSLRDSPGLAQRRWGICLYAEWTTGEAEWGVYRRLWLDN